MSTVWNWIKQHWLKTLLITLGILLALITPPFIIHAMYKTVARNPYFESTWSSGDLITYIAGFEAFIGTVFLGVVAVRQNDKANDLNELFLEQEEKRAKLERIPSTYLVDYSYKLMKLSEKLNTYDNSFLHIHLHSDEDENIVDLSICLRNVSKVFIEAIFQFATLHYIAGNKEVKFEGLSNGSKSNIFFMPPNEHLTLHFALSTSDYFYNYPTLVTLHLKLRNPIGESYLYQISFYAIGNPDNIYFYQTTYDYHMLTDKSDRSSNVN